MTISGTNKPLTAAQIQKAAKDGKITAAEAKKLGIANDVRAQLNKDIKDGGKLTKSEVANAIRADKVEAKPKPAPVDVKPATAGQVNKAEAAAEKIDDVLSELDKARGERDELDGKLKHQLAEVGPGLSKDQIDAYEKSFRQKHGAVYAKVEKLEAKLSGILKNRTTLLERATVAGSKDAARQLLDGYEALARSQKHADEAIKWLGALGDKGSSKVRGKLDQLTSGKLNERLHGLLANALPNAQADIFSTSDNKAEALKKMKSLLSGVSKATELGDIASGTKKFLDAIEHGVEKKDYRALKQDLLTGFKEKGPLGKAFAVAGVAQCAFDAANAIKDGDLGRAITSTLGAGQSMLELSAGVLGTFRSTAKTAAKVAGLGGRLAPGVNLILGAANLGNDIKNALDDPSNAGRWIQAFGSAVSMIPVVGIIGVGINAIGGLIAKAITGDRENKKETAEETLHLQHATGMNAADARELATTGLADLERLRGLGLSPKQIQGLVRSDNVALNQAEAAVLIRIAGLFDLKGKQAADFIRKAAGALDKGEAEELLRTYQTHDPYQGMAHVRSLQARMATFFMTKAKGTGLAAEVLGVKPEKVRDAITALNLMAAGMEVPPRYRYNPPEPNQAGMGSPYGQIT